MGYEFNQKIEPNNLPISLTNLIFSHNFNQKIKPNILPELLTNLTFGNKFDKKIEPNTLSDSITTLTFGYFFNQKIEPNSLPEKLTTLTFGYFFNQKIEPNSLPSNLKYIEFNWIWLRDKINISSYIEMVNNIPSYYNVKIFVVKNILGDNDLKWPIYVCNYSKNRWPVELYEMVNNYTHPIYGNIITIIINKKTYQPYSSTKSALK